jgi:glycine oxidase
MNDVVIIGAGVIGLSLAHELAREGVACRVLDSGQPGRESSWAGAGILPPGSPEHAESPEARLRAASHVLWPEFSDRLRDETGIDNGFRRCGGIEARLDGRRDALDGEIAAWRREGVAVDGPERETPQAWEPSLSPRVSAAYRLPAMGQVRNPRHLKALLAALARRGVPIEGGTPVWGFERRGSRIVAARSCAGRITGDAFVIAGGAWSAGLLAQAEMTVAVRPLRGQIVLLSTQSKILSHVINVGPRYLVPRDDGRVLIGATEENAGFDKSTTAAGVAGLIEFGIELVPELARATVERAWAGLRPQSADGLPYLGRGPGFDNLFVATGHFRAGLQLSPITALLMSQLIRGAPTSLSLAPFAIDRRVEPFVEPDARHTGEGART